MGWIVKYKQPLADISKATDDDFLAYVQNYAKLLDLMTRIFPSIDLYAVRMSILRFYFV